MNAARLAVCLMCCWWAARAPAGTFGRVIPIAGHVADVALDERRGVAYVANYTANRVDVVSLAGERLETSLNVAQQPSGVALSADGRWLVVTHFANFVAPLRPSNSLTVLNLDGNQRQTFMLGAPPLGVAFGIDNRALVVTTQDFLLLEPETGVTRVLDSIQGVVAQTLPAPAGTWPANVVRASVAASGDGFWVVGILEVDGEDRTLVFTYNVNSRQVRGRGMVTRPPLGPRAISVSQDGGMFAAGWGVFTTQPVLLAQFRNASGALGKGSVALDSARGLLYAQIEQAAVAGQGQGQAAPPVLLVAEADNLTVREQLQLPANLAGKALLSSDGRMMYAVAESGLAVLPVGELARQPRVVSRQEDVLFRGGFCDRRPMVEEIELVDPGGGRTDFSLSVSPGIAVSPSSGVTPARVRVVIDPNQFQNQKGTTVGWIQIRSQAAVNLPPPVRVLVNMREPDQRGTLIHVPGKLVDIVGDAARNRFYVLRQDKNQALVYDAGYRLIRALRTPNTPTQMAMTLDRQRLLIGADDSQLAYVYNLDTLEAEPPVVFPAGHYPRSLAASGRAILAAARVAGPRHAIDRVDLNLRVATELPTLGIWENKIQADTTLAVTPNGAAILVAQSDGNVMLYSANEDTFVLSRKDFQKLGGAYAALSEDRFVVDNHLLDGSLRPIQSLETASGLSSGFVLAEGLGVRTTAPDAAGAGVIQRVELGRGAMVRPTRMTEAPVLADAAQPPAFTRTLAALPGAGLLVSLSTSGLTALSWNYDAAVADPRIERVVNAADGTAGVAPGGLITILGRDLSLVNAATREVPLPTALAESCLTVNGVLTPMVLVSPTQINAQLPFSVSGAATVILRAPAGVSNSFRFTIQAAAPAVFRTGVAGEDSGLPTVVRVRNNQLVTLSNPIHPEDAIVIYLTGLGATTPAVADGHPGPHSPLAWTSREPTVTLGGVELPVLFAGMTPGQVGVYQINARVPHWVPLGMDVPLRIVQAGEATTLMVRVVK